MYAVASIMLFVIAALLVTLALRLLARMRKRGLKCARCGFLVAGSSLCTECGLSPSDTIRFGLPRVSLCLLMALLPAYLGFAVAQLASERFGSCPRWLLAIASSYSGVVSSNARIQVRHELLDRSLSIDQWHGVWSDVLRDSVFGERGNRSVVLRLLSSTADANGRIVSHVVSRPYLARPTGEKKGVSGMAPRLVHVPFSTMEQVLDHYDDEETAYLVWQQLAAQRANADLPVVRRAVMASAMSPGALALAKPATALVSTDVALLYANALSETCDSCNDELLTSIFLQHEYSDAALEVLARFKAKATEDQQRTITRIEKAARQMKRLLGSDPIRGG